MAFVPVLLEMAAEGVGLLAEAGEAEGLVGGIEAAGGEAIAGGEGAVAGEIAAGGEAAAGGEIAAGGEGAAAGGGEVVAGGEAAGGGEVVAGGEAAAGGEGAAGADAAAGRGAAGAGNAAAQPPHPLVALLKKVGSATVDATIIYAVFTGLGKVFGHSPSDPGLPSPLQVEFAALQNTARLFNKATLDWKAWFTKNAANAVNFGTTTVTVTNAGMSSTSTLNRFDVVRGSITSMTQQYATDTAQLLLTANIKKDKDSLDKLRVVMKKYVDQGKAIAASIATNETLMVAAGLKSNMEDWNLASTAVELQ